MADQAKAENGWESEESKALLTRIRLRTATAFEQLKFAEVEMWTALANLPPAAHTRGATDEGDADKKPISDPQHASACVFRAVAAVRKARERLEKEFEERTVERVKTLTGHGLDGSISVILNGARVDLLPPAEWTYERFVAAFAQAPDPTITWRTEVTSGTLVRGESVRVMDGMVINIA